MMTRFYLSLCLLFLLAACGTKDNVTPPAELKDIQETLTTRKVWSEDAGSGSGKQFIRLYPFLAQDSIFVADHDGRMKALAITDGDEVWSVDTDLPLNAGVNGGEGHVLAGGSEGVLIALQADNGNERWRVELGSEIQAISAAEQGTAVVRTNDGAVYGIQLSDGSQSWKYASQLPALTLRSSSVPLVQNGRVYVGLDNGKVVALSLTDGNLLWERTLASSRGRNELDRMVDIDGQMVLFEGRLYVVSYQGRIAALDADNGRVIWSRDASSSNGLAVGNDAVFYSDSDSTLWALDKQSGNTLWQQPDLAHRQLSAPAVVGDHVLVTDFEGYVHWLSAEDGHFVSRDKSGSAPTLSAPRVQDERVYILDQAGNLSVWQVRS